jgi:CRP-like cAMP-binding protein
VLFGDPIAGAGHPEVVRRFGPGDLVWGAAVLGGVAEPWQARAVVPTSGLSFPIEALLDLMEEHFDLVRSTMVALGSRREVLLDHLAGQSAPLILT